MVIFHSYVSLPEGKLPCYTHDISHPSVLDILDIAPAIIPAIMTTARCSRAEAAGRPEIPMVFGTLW